MSSNRFYNRGFDAGPGQLAQAGALRNEFTSLQAGLDLVQAELDALRNIGGFSLPNSLEGNAGMAVVVNSTEDGYSLVALGGIRIKSISATTYTLVASDAGALILFTAGTAVTVTVPPSVLAQGDVVCMRQQGAGQVTVSAGSGVTVSSSDALLKTRKQFAQIALVCDSATSNLFGLIGERNADPTGAALLAAANTFTRSNSVTPVALTDAATINTDASLSNTFTVTLAGNRALANPSNMTNGEVMQWYVKQDATGSRTLTYGSNFKFPGGTTPTLTTTANAVDLITGQYIASLGIIACTVAQDIR